MTDQLMVKVGPKSLVVSSSEASLPSSPAEVHQPLTTKTWQQRFVKQYNSVMSWSSSVLRVVQAVGGIIEKFYNLRVLFKVFFKATKIPKISLSPYVFADFISNISKIFYGRVTSDKVKGGLKAVTNLDSLVNSTVSTIKILTTAKIVADVFKNWFDYIAKGSFFISFIPLGFSIDSLYRMWSLHGSLASKIDAADAAQCNNCKRKNLQEAFELIQKEGTDKLREKLSISKKADLAGRVDRLKSALMSSKNKKKEEVASAVKAASEFLKELSTRIRYQRNYELGDTAIKVVGIVGDIFTLFTPLALVGAGIFLATSVASLAMMSGRAMLMRKNPFDQYCRSRGEALLEKVFHYGTQTIPSTQQERSVVQEKESRPVRSSRKTAQVASHYDLRPRSTRRPVEAAA